MCWLNVSLRPIVTPKYLACFDQLTGWLSMVRGGMWVVLERPKRTPTVLVGFILIRHLWNQFDARLSWCCSCMVARLGFLLLVKNIVSSAKSERMALGVVGMSLMYVKYSIGERQEP